MLHYLSRVARTANAVLAAALLSACASTPSQPPGGLILHMSSNRLGATLTYIPKSIDLESIDTATQKHDYHTLKVTTGAGKTTTFGAALPPGKYWITKLNLNQASVRILHNTTGSFVVESGKLTYLGDVQLLTTPEPGAKPVGGYFDARDTRLIMAHAGSAVKLENGAALAHRHFPELAPMATLPMTSWTPGTYDSDKMQKLFPFIRRTATGNYSPLDLGAEGMLFGADNGLIRKVKPGSTTTLLDTGSPFAIIGLTKMVDGALLALSADSNLHVSRDQGKSWQAFPLLPPKGWVDEVQVGPAGALFAMLFNAGELQVYRTRPGDTEWTLLHRSRRASDLKPMLVPHGSTMLLTDHNDQLTLIDCVTGAVSTRPLPGHTLNFSRAPDGRLFVDSQLLGARKGRGLFMSNDSGQTWVPLPTPELFEGLYFQDDRHFLAVANGAGARPIYFTTQDGGATWSPVRVGQAHDPLAFASDGTLYIESSPTQLHYSRDDGKSWKLVDMSTGMETPQE